MYRVCILYLDVIGAYELTHSNFEWEYLREMSFDAVEGGLRVHVLKNYLA